MNLYGYNAINASAGSGKTYTLVQRILIICLQSKRNDVIRHILALTFTNKAANEMKYRLIEWLKAFTEENYKENRDLKGIQQKIKEIGIQVSIEELHERAIGVLNYVLHNYSTLNISTIDKFNLRLLRSFSYELGLPYQFSIEITPEPYIIKAVDILINKIGEDKKISEIFMDLVNYSFDNDEKIDISKTLYDGAKKYINDAHYQHLKENINFDWDSYIQIRDAIRDAIDENKKEAKRIAEESLKLIHDRNLEESDFSGGRVNGIMLFFSKFIKNGVPNLYDESQKEEKRLENFQKGASANGKKRGVETAIYEIIDTLVDSYQKIIYLYVEQIKYQAILKELLPFKFNKEIQDNITSIEEEEDLVLLSKSNIIINENLKSEPSDFIYEKIGTKFQHFFVDEFQDTSKMQWSNMLPMRDNAISDGQNSFTIVGDPKQSIYRFRGGDSGIMMAIINKEEGNTIIPVQVENLEYNWRSARNIVEFNNELYHFIGNNDLVGNERKLFAEDGQQKFVQKISGRVKINITECTKKEDFFENSSEQMYRDIQKCLDLGYSLSDIMIICRKNHEIREYSKHLGEKEIIYKGKKQFIKLISDRGITLGYSLTLKALIEFIKWQITPKDKTYIVKTLYYLNLLGRVNIEDFTKEITEILSENDIENTLKIRFGIDISINKKLNLYNYIEYYVKIFSVKNKETDFILNFLENIYDFSQNKGLSLKDFVKYWDEEAHGKSIQVSENIEAIKLMTIHSAKGLESPIVFVPLMENTNKSGTNKQSDWFNVGTGSLKSVNIKEFNKNLSIYDEEIDKFNKNIQYKQKVDDSCVLYVATTRPREHLYLYLQKKKENEGILKFIDNKMNGLPDENEFDLYPNTEENWRKIAEEHSEKNSESISIELEYSTKEWENIRIATPSKSYQNKSDKVREGIFLHEIMSKIKTKKDVDRILETYKIEGKLTNEEKQKIKIRVQSIVEDIRYQKYFEEGLQVLTEKDIMIYSNKETHLFRPDRLVKMPDGWVIIDFKTGEKDKKEYQEQVNTYKVILEKLGRKVVGTEIIYL